MSQVTVRVDQVGPTTSEGQVREHRVLVDRPSSKGGADAGAMGGELLLIALGGCFMSNLLAAVNAREAAISDVRLLVEGRLESAPPRFGAVHMQVSADYDDRAQMEKLLTIAHRGCICANTLGAAVELTIALESPEPQAEA